MSARVRLTVQAAVATMAAATALSAVFSDSKWFLPVAGAVAVVAIVNELTRRSPAAAAVGPLLSAAAVLIYLTVTETGDAALGGVIPTPASLQALAQVARTGFSDIRSLASPVPTHQGLVLLAVVGIAAVHLVVDLLAVTLRKAAVAGLPLLAVFALCTAVSKRGAGWIPFIIGAAGYLWLLLGDSRDRIGRWGRTLGADPATRPRITWADIESAAPSPLAALGRRVGATAIAVGVVLPLLVPGLHGGLPKTGGTGVGNGKGSNQVVTLNPIVSIRAQLTAQKPVTILTFRTSDPSPGYLRLTSLDQFDGTTFSPSTLVASSQQRVSHGIAASGDSGLSEQTTVSVGKFSAHWLPLPTQVSDVQVKGDWRYDPQSNTVFSAKADTKDLTYTVSSIRYEPSATDLESSGYAAHDEFAHYLTLPPGIIDRLQPLATSITEHAQTPFDKALAIQRYLTSPPFVYDTSVAADDSTSALANFLLVTKRGFCQQYAAAMAVLARLVEIPSRVAVGFTRGTKQADGTWVVTSHDAHAWPELYFPGYGWMRFEPTPRADGQAIAPAFTRPASAQTPSDVGPRNPGSTGSTSSSTSTLAAKHARDNGTAVLPAPARVRQRHTPIGVWIALAVVVVLLALPGTVRAATRRRRWAAATGGRSAAHQAWAELRATAVDAGAGWSDAATPRAAGRVLSAELGLDADARRALDRLVEAEQRARYAPEPVDRPARDLREDVRTVAAAMFADAGALRRVVAVVWPASTLRGVRRVGVRFADLLDLLDSAGARLRQRVATR